MLGDGSSRVVYGVPAVQAQQVLAAAAKALAAAEAAAAGHNEGLEAAVAQAAVEAASGALQEGKRLVQRVKEQSRCAAASLAVHLKWRSPEWLLSAVLFLLPSPAMQCSACRRGLPE